MNELIKVNLNENQEPIVSARELHKALEIKTRFSQWVDQNFKVLEEGYDFSPVVKTTQLNQYGGEKELKDYALTLDSAKHLAMLSKTDKGAEARRYFIQVEKDFNSPEKVMARALKYADQKILSLETQIEQDKPKVLFADSVSASRTSILVGELAKLIKQSGYDIGQRRLFQWLRENGYLIKRKGTDWNMPTQYSMERGWFEIKETAVTNADGSVRVTKTPKVTGKGQLFFVNKFLT